MLLGIKHEIQLLMQSTHTIIYFTLKTHVPTCIISQTVINNTIKPTWILKPTTQVSARKRYLSLHLEHTKQTQ